ncbi:hypothetical protein [Hoylesella shahii]|jgi:hypothetical protein|uniref:hypothetical protein n=1 Tax=Hoylesella shahii TaxID=228603 RepID=UPI002356A8CC|nr:hypothetical protein [Hoylesella shahii]
MKRNVLVLFLWVLGIVANISCTSKPRGKTKFQDSIVVFFRPIYSSKIVSAKELIMMSAKVPVLDTLFVDNRDYDAIKNFIENRKKIRAKIKGVPEVYLKTKSGIVFLTQFNPLAVDIDGNPIAISMEMAYRINICSKMYNYYTKEEILWDTLFKRYSLPKEYRYYYDRYYQEFKNNDQKIDSIFVTRKRGVKLWLIARDNNS